MFDQFLADPMLLVAEWYRWTVAVAFAVTFVSTLWIFFDSYSNFYAAGMWRTLSLLCALIVIPGAVLSFFPKLAEGLGELPIWLAFAGMIATVFSLLVLLLYSIGIGVHALGASDEPDLDYDPVPVGEQEGGPAHESPTPPLPRSVTVPAQQIAAEGADTSDLPADSTRILQPQPDDLAPLAWLVLMNGQRAGHEFRLGELTDIGRGSKHNDIGLDDWAISRQHARVRLENGEFVLYDLASANGVLINGEPAQRQVLSNGDRVRMGESEFGFMLVGE